MEILPGIVNKIKYSMLEPPFIDNLNFIINLIPQNFKYFNIEHFSDKPNNEI